MSYFNSPLKYISITKSYGIIPFSIINNKIHYLMIRRKNTFGYIDIIKGKYNINNFILMQNLIDIMTINEKNDICIGSRYIKGINVVNWPLQRIILSYFASLYVRLITGMRIMDPTSGFVCYSVKSLQNLNLSEIKFNGYAFQIEMKFKLFLKKSVLTEIPIIFTDRKFGKSKLNGSIIGEAVFGVISMKLKSFFS